MHSFRTVATLAALIGAVLTGCASTKPNAYQELASASRLAPVRGGNNQFEYTNPKADLRHYANLTLEPVTIYTGADSQFGSVPAESRSTIADYMQQQFSTELGKRVQIVETPSEPSTARLHLTLTGIETSTPVVSTLSHVVPVGFLVNAGLGASKHGGTFFGSVSYAAEIYDAATGELIYASVSRRTPSALDIGSSIGRLDATKKGVRLGAQDLREKLIKMEIVESPKRFANAAQP
jgi:Protein of unknown function (DUF3313)